MTAVNATTTASIVTADQMYPILQGLLDYAITCSAEPSGPIQKISGPIQKVEALRAQYLAKQLENGCMVFHNFLNAPTEFTERDQEIIYAGITAGITRCQLRGAQQQLGLLQAVKAMLDDGFIVIP